MIALPNFNNFFFKKKEAFSFGVDIGTSFVKIVKLRFTKDGDAQLCDFYIDSVSIDLSPILQKIQQAQVVIGSCGLSVMLRHVPFPKMSAFELKQAMRFEAQKHIPFSIAEVNLDACILKPDMPDGKMLVLVAAIKKDFVNQRLKLIESAGLKVRAIDVDSLALVNAFNFNYATDEGLKNKTIAMLNIGSSFTNLNIVEDSVPKLSRDIQIGGNAFTKRLADVLNLDSKMAEEVKLHPDSKNAQDISLVLGYILSNLVNEIRSSFDYYETQNASCVEKIFLSGAASLYPGLKEMLASALGMEVLFWDPLKQVKLAENIDAQKVKEVSSQLCVAVGLALRK